MFTYIKIAGAGLVVASLIILGWNANGWRLKAAQAETLRLELRNELQRRVAEQVKVREANEARIKAELALQKKQAAITEKVKIVKQTVIKHVKANPDCDIPDPVASELQRLRTGGE
jgi:hypothetical protein